MLTLENTPQHAKQLVDAILERGQVPVFDLDGVAFDATHRQKIYNQQDVENGLCTVDQIGQLDLNHYRASTTAELVAQDKNLPMLQAIHMLNRLGKPYHVATARVVDKCQHSSKLLKDRGINPDVLICRNGDNDLRRDSVLKSEELCKRFTQRQRENMVLIDDSLGNCKAVKQIGLKAVNVPFRGF